jgi:hypothetical protein
MWTGNRRPARARCWLVAGVTAATLCCRGNAPPRDGGDLEVRQVTPEDLPADVRGTVEDTARRQAVAADRTVATIRRAYPYEGYSWYEPTAEGKLVAVDVELVGYTADFDLDDIDLVDGVTGENYGSDPQVALLTRDGQLAKDEPREWPPAPKPLRLLLIYAAPRSLESVRLGYWGRDLTASAFPLGGAGPSLPRPDTKPRP